MYGKSYLKIVWIVAFIAFAACSCWATAESLHLLLPSWPHAMAYVVTIGFFIIASIASKMVVDSLNTNVYIEHRKNKLILGILLLIIFWLVCSMPTNTHTFLYRNVIEDKTSADISTTQGYLSQLMNNTSVESKIKEAQNDLENRVNVKLGELQSEIENDANPGFGPKSTEILRSFAEMLGVAKVEPLSYKGTSKQERAMLVDAYRTKIYTLMNAKKESIRLQMQTTNQDYINEATKSYDEIAKVTDQIKEKKLNLNKAEDINAINNVVTEGYNTVRKHSALVSFLSPSDKEKYTSDHPVTEIKKLISVFDTWKAVLSGEYTGYNLSFWLWVVISILVDIAAFIFFDLAFKKEEF